MKTTLIALLVANLLLGAWLAFGEPLDSEREPARSDMQIDSAKFRLLSEADMDAMRDKAQKAAAAAAAAASQLANQPAAPTPASAIPADLPSESCIEIGDFGSESAARKMRTRLASIGMGDRITMGGADRAARLHITGVTADDEAQIDTILKDYPKQQLTHCPDGHN
jgi:hypothetical protein